MEEQTQTNGSVNQASTTSSHTNPHSSSSLVGEDSFEWPPDSGFIYKLGPIIYKIEARFEQKCERDELKSIERRRGEISDETWKYLFDAHLDRMGRKVWAWSGKASVLARQEWEGQKDLVAILMDFYNPVHVTSVQGIPVVTRALIDEIFDKEQGKYWGMLAAKIARLNDPNPTAPIQKEEEG